MAVRTPQPDAALRAKAETVDHLLQSTYGDPEWAPKLDGTSELVLTILSQHTSDRNSAAAFDNLWSRYNGDWEAVAYAPTEEVAEAIRSAGLSNIKAPRIQAVLREIQARTGALDLGFLPRMPLQDAKAWLTSLDGVGPKTAACVLMFSYGLPVMPVDTHVHRVSRRLGLIGPRVGANLAHDQIAALVPAERAYAFHINLIRHGRQICKAPVPRCHVCPLTSVCDYYQTNVHAAADAHEEVPR
jgi:endonuclease-3